MEQNHKGIKFHSILFRVVIFLAAVIIMLFYVEGGSDVVRWGESNFAIEVKQLCLILNILCIMAFIFCSFTNWKVSICRGGVYLKKIDLFVPWEELVAVSHTWINQYNGSRSSFVTYNRKTLVIYREEYKPICVYNISLLALFAIKFFAPQIKTNVVFATLATLLNVVLNAGVFYWGYALNYKIEAMPFLIWIVLYLLKCLALPLIMVKRQNAIYGDYLRHDGIKKNRSAAIHL